MKLILKRNYFAKQTEGILELWYNKQLIYKCYTLELPWLNNERNISCIPEGEYMIYKEVQKTRGNVFRFSKVDGRSGVLIHKGNFVTHTKGCVLPGQNLTDINKDGLRDVTDSKNTMDKLFKLIDQEEIYITIKS